MIKKFFEKLYKKKEKKPLTFEEMFNNYKNQIIENLKKLILINKDLLKKCKSCMHSNHGMPRYDYIINTRLGKYNYDYSDADVACNECCYNIFNVYDYTRKHKSFISNYVWDYTREFHKCGNQSCEFFDPMNNNHCLTQTHVVTCKSFIESTVTYPELYEDIDEN